MRRMVVALFTVLAVTVPVAYASPVPSPQQKQQQPTKEEKEKTASLTGCVDEQEGHYVLVDDRDLSRIADLEADGFPTEGFAKHVGHKVTVRGIRIPGGERTLLRVRTVATISET